MPPGLQAFQGVSQPALHPFTVVPHGAGIVAEPGVLRQSRCNQPKKHAADAHAPGQHRLQIGGGDGSLMERRRCRETPIDLGNELQGFALAVSIRIDNDWKPLKSADVSEMFWSVKPRRQLGKFNIFGNCSGRPIRLAG